MATQWTSFPGPSPILESHGPLIVGVIVNVFLYGVQVTQTASYYEKFHRDPLWLKVYVGVLFLADTLNTIFAVWGTFVLFVNNWAKIEAYFVADWLLRTDPAMGGIIAFYCQLFFAWRIYVLTERKLLVAFIAILGFCVCVGGVGIAIALGIQPQLALINNLRPLVLVWLVPSVVADVVITISMVYFLRKRKTGFKKTQDLINRITRLTVQSCLLTTLCSTGDLLSYLLASDKGYHIGFSYPIPKLYSNAVLSSLNSRSSDKQVGAWEQSSGHPDTLELSHVSQQSTGILSEASRRIKPITGSQQKHTGTEVYVDVERQVIDDGDKVKSGHGWDEDGDSISRQRNVK